MRKNDDYRPAIRNAVRALGNLRRWFTMNLQGVANDKAKLAMRAGQALAARTIAFKHIAMHPNTWRREVPALLRKFWMTQERTRVVSRILRELPA